jgi:heme exporter protein A
MRSSCRVLPVYPCAVDTSGSGARAAVEAIGLCRRYGRRWALADVSFELVRGRVSMVAGRNGSGKSTLLRVLATAIRADRGTLRVLGLDSREQRDEVRQATSLLAHDSYHYEALTALDNLRILARFIGAESSRAALRERLAQVDLAERADDAVRGFSAGMRKRLSLARTLLKDAQVVLLDEPYAALDPPGFRLVDRLLAGWRERGRTVVMATHLIEHGRTLCDDAIVLEAGRLALAGRAADVPDDVGPATGAPQEPLP